MKTATRKDWRIVPMPKRRAQLAIDRTFSREEMNLIKRGFIPQQMEQKWFIFFERNRLYVHRSWTGFCIYMVKCEKKSNGYLISRAEVNRDAEQYSEADNVYDAKLLLYLIDGALLGRPVKFPSRAGESSAEDEEDEGSPETPVMSQPKASGEPPLNGDLLTDEERATPMGLGYTMAATRLNLIYLASIPAMEKLLRDHAKEALTLHKLCHQDALPKSQLYAEVDKITQRLAKVLRGEDPRYMAIPWFTDPNQLRQSLYAQFHADFGDDPKYSGWKADPVREQACCFLEFAVEIADEAETQGEFTHRINEHIRLNVAGLLGIPESHYKYPPQEAGENTPEKSGDENAAF
jgi:hypothetical protein